MKKEALRRGAEEEPISGTGGIEEGSGVVSTRTCWLNLEDGFIGGEEVDLLGLSRRHGGCLAEGESKAYAWLRVQAWLADCRAQLDANEGRG